MICGAQTKRFEFLTVPPPAILLGASRYKLDLKVTRFEAREATSFVKKSSRPPNRKEPWKVLMGLPPCWGTSVPVEFEGRENAA